MERRIQVSAAILLATAVFVFAYSSSILFVTARKSDIVTTGGVGAYWDRGCTKTVSTINWGNIEPGSMKNVTIYLKNQADTSITVSLNSTNWNPTNASEYISIGWSYLGQEIRPGRVVQVSLSLTLSRNISGVATFTFDIIIGSHVNVS